ncbi:nitrite reductase/ring-hydroxylating ferredoxin subunit [Buttiauxella sp. BIGb0552]|uniref:Rieske (2Fe-2S) protein n=1 Tax=Buttiauxella sp. BIGb0552 TaxID=2485120 RepID=UPI0010D1BF89|nr:Rieske (2Fe-2S) protein [Buttiauxella sp. BIGb0552]TDX18555.1 nitrite reductase/ring-hydroxylating ferredoxin subunit [Buttiauxella sp. BIGb0552]
MMHQPIALFQVNTLQEGEARGLDPQQTGQQTLLAVRYSGKLYLWRNNCPHQNVPMNWQRDAFLNAKGNKIMCFAHGALFEPDSGLCIQGACYGQRLTPVDFAINTEGWVTIRDPKDETGNP